MEKGRRNMATTVLRTHQGKKDPISHYKAMQNGENARILFENNDIPFTF